MTALFIDLDFPPNGAENYKHVLIGDFFPSEIPETAYDVQVYSISGFGQGWNEAYLSYRDAPEHIKDYSKALRVVKNAVNIFSQLSDDGLQNTLMCLDEYGFAQDKFLEAVAKVKANL